MGQQRVAVVIEKQQQDLMAEDIMEERNTWFIGNGSLPLSERSNVETKTKTTPTSNSFNCSASTVDLDSKVLGPKAYADAVKTEDSQLAGRREDSKQGKSSLTVTW